VKPSCDGILVFHLMTFLLHCSSITCYILKKYSIHQHDSAPVLTWYLWLFSLLHWKLLTTFYGLKQCVLANQCTWIIKLKIKQSLLVVTCFLYIFECILPRGKQ
jgi:hypothetical protein